jgi:beta-glucanase (GH16 family)
VGAVEVDYQSSNLLTRVLFSDDFDGPRGTSPSALRWHAVTGGTGWGNHEQETYTDRPKNASLDGRGHLRIVARRETYMGADGIRRPYTSARLETATRFGFQYGHAAARIRIPHGIGLWPAFWALGDNYESVGWPLCGEMDIMENRGSQPRIVHGVAVAARSGGGRWISGSPLRYHRSLAHGYHTYGVVWGPSGIAISLDGRTYMSVASADLPPQNLWNFNHSFHLILNLAVGGDWPGAPALTTPFPGVMSVDYVRVSG